jgi:hypothetical protein
MYIAPNGKLYTKDNRYISLDGFEKIYLPFGIVRIVFASQIKPRLN